ncbi:hypothetical protein CAG99_12755 [Streptomyces marincola]|uniref:Uncharacterized protein n=2 Tax=Streptomyces marincola TaxID=2878388 RepID=A0A1W7CXT4_9ACTN|nr:hypothetical protein CAG99_12755 [Streptomyces marincola]
MPVPPSGGTGARATAPPPAACGGADPWGRLPALRGDRGNALPVRAELGQRMPHEPPGRRAWPVAAARPGAAEQARDDSLARFVTPEVAEAVRAWTAGLLATTAA